MDLDSTKERRKPQVKPKGQGKEYYNYGKEGHFAKDCKKLRKEIRKEIRAMLEFPKINYNNYQVEDSQEDEWLKVETIKYSWDSSSQLPKVPTVPEKDNDRILEYISEASTSGTCDQLFEEHL
jgi:hypothetical protein